MKMKTVETTFESSPWSSQEPVVAPAVGVTVRIADEHLRQAGWSQYRDPVSLAINEILNEDALAQVFWNSDSWIPRYPEDDARIGVYVWHEQGRREYWQPLPTRATRFLHQMARHDVLWKLRTGRVEEWPEEVSMRVKLPVAALNPAFCE